MQQVVYKLLGKKEHQLFCSVQEHSHYKYSEDITAHQYWG